MSKPRSITIARIQTGGGPLPPEDKMEFLWQRMAASYGEKWTINYTKTPLPEWCAVLAPLARTQIIKGIETSLTSGKEYPPTLPLFLRYCLDIRETDIEERCLRPLKSFDRMRMTRDECDRVKNTRRPEAIREIIAERLGSSDPSSVPPSRPRGPSPGPGALAERIPNRVKTGWRE